MQEHDHEFRSTWIIGYGNPHRKDDGIGPYVVEQVSPALGLRTEIALRSTHQLDPVLAEEVRGAKVLILIDATVEPLEGGLRWTRIQPDGDGPLRDTHRLQPSLLAAILESLYQQSPAIWLVSVEGKDFEFGEGLSPEGQEKAGRASREIIEFCLGQGIDKGRGFHQ